MSVLSVEVSRSVGIITVFYSTSTIPPEKQAEAKELSATLTELQATIAQEYQEAVGHTHMGTHTPCPLFPRVTAVFKASLNWTLCFVAPERAERHRSRMENQDS